MTYHLNISAPPSDAAESLGRQHQARGRHVLLGGALDQDVLDEALEDEVGGVEEDADDHAGDQHDDHALDQLVLRRPLDLLQLGPRLGDEPRHAAAACSPRLAGRLGTTRVARRRTPGRRGRSARKSGLAAGGDLLPAGAALRTCPGRPLAALPGRGNSYATEAGRSGLLPSGGGSLSTWSRVV